MSDTKKQKKYRKIPRNTAKKFQKILFLILFNTGIFIEKYPVFFDILGGIFENFFFTEKYRKF